MVTWHIKDFPTLKDGYLAHVTLVTGNSGLARALAIKGTLKIHGTCEKRRTCKLLYGYTYTPHNC